MDNEKSVASEPSDGLASDESDIVHKASAEDVFVCPYCGKTFPVGEGVKTAKTVKYRTERHMLSSNLPVELRFVSAGYEVLFCKRCTRRIRLIKWTAYPILFLIIPLLAFAYMYSVFDGEFCSEEFMINLIVVPFIATPLFLSLPIYFMICRLCFRFDIGRAFGGNAVVRKFPRDKH